MSFVMMYEFVSYFAEIDTAETLNVDSNKSHSFLACCIDIVMNDLSGLSV